jgi:DNA-binding beta-propeller fold protein YncE
VTNTGPYPRQDSEAVIPIDTATNTAGTPIKVGNGPDTIAVPPDGNTAYVASGSDAYGIPTADTVTPVNIATQRPGPAIDVGIGPIAIAIEHY